MEIVESGFIRVKMKVGKQNSREDLDRDKAIRSAIGDDIILMIEVSQQWNITTAMTLGKKLEDFDIYWPEDPPNQDDVLNHRKLADELVPTILGEHLYSKYAFRDYIHQGALEYIRVDVTQVSGITEWLRVPEVFTK